MMPSWWRNVGHANAGALHHRRARPRVCEELVSLAAKRARVATDRPPTLTGTTTSKRAAVGAGK